MHLAYYERTYHDAKNDAAKILLDRLKTCEPSDTLSIVLSLKELLEPTISEIYESETTAERHE